MSARQNSRKRRRGDGVTPRRRKRAVDWGRSRRRMPDSFVDQPPRHGDLVEGRPDRRVDGVDLVEVLAAAVDLAAGNGAIVVDPVDGAAEAVEDAVTEVENQDADD